LVGVEEDGDPPDIGGILERISNDGDVKPWLRETARRLLDDPGRQVVAHPSGGLVLRSSRRKRYRAVPAVNEPQQECASDPDFTSQDNASSFVSRKISLLRHSQGVGELAKTFASGCDLGDDLKSDIALAGTLHDVGKADPRFQRWLHGGDEIAAASSEPLAKSGMRDRRLRERARVLAGYPKHARHELLSLAMIEPEVRSLDARDAELMLYLVSSHHGFCRPFAPAFDEPGDLPAVVDGIVSACRLQASTVDAAKLARIDSGVADRYWSLVRRFGWFGLPYLEAILRLADHRRSELDELEANES
jgi:CRISPR-associated endonuclease/helicase Cas3